MFSAEVRAMLAIFGMTVLAAATSSAAPAADTAPTSTSTSSAVVYLADGTQFPLLGWSLSYEYVSGNVGEMPSKSETRDVHELRLGGRSWPLAGVRLEITYEMLERTRETDSGETVKETVPRVTALTLTQGGKTSKLKPQPPDRKFLIGDGKASVVLPRTVDLRGETLTGTQRELCLMSFSGLAECGIMAEGRVVKVEFQ
jgi:hypothetical protein